MKVHRTPPPIKNPDYANEMVIRQRSFVREKKCTAKFAHQHDPLRNNEDEELDAFINLLYLNTKNFPLKYTPFESITTLAEILQTNKFVYDLVAFGEIC